jgi:hypothetical protein
MREPALAGRRARGLRSETEISEEESLMTLSVRSISKGALAAVLSVAASGCGSDEVKYEPRPGPSGVKANIPAVPNVPQKPIKAGDAYTIWGASYYLRSRVYKKEVAGKKLSLTGYISHTNLADAPECAVHKAGKADPENCKPPIPAFWLCDTKEAPDKECIKVMGWASNFAQLYDAIEKYDKVKDGEQPKEPHLDTFWGVNIPFPIPAKGAKVTVNGDYSSTFTRSSTGAEADPIMGIMTLDKITYIEPAAEKATLPGMKK